MLADCDPIWDRLPTSWEEAPYLGNGLIGSMVWCSRDQTGRTGSYVITAQPGSCIRFHQPSTQVEPTRLCTPTRSVQPAPFGMNAAFYARRPYYAEGGSPLSLRGVKPSWA